MRGKTICFPYVITRGLDVTHPSYRKAAHFIAKSNPSEILQVDNFLTTSTVPRKRKRGSKRLEADEAYFSSQGNFKLPIAMCSGLTPPLANDSRTTSQIINDAGRACRVDVRVNNNALLRQEVATRDQLHVTSHTLAYHLRLFEFNKAEHDLLLKEIGERQLFTLQEPQT